MSSPLSRSIRGSDPESLVAAGKKKRKKTTCNFCPVQPLSTFALDAIELFDRESAYRCAVGAEATLENPRQVLYAQQSRARGEAVAVMNAEGIEYEERVELVEEIIVSQPLADLLRRPTASTPKVTRGSWNELRPKSVAREMYEMAMTFVSSSGSQVGCLRGAGAALLGRCPQSVCAGPCRGCVPRSWRTPSNGSANWRQVDLSLLDEGNSW